MPVEQGLGNEHKDHSGYGPIIDCDIHNEVPSLDSLYQYLPDFWCDYINESAFVGPDANDYPKGAPTTGGPSSSDLATIRKQALDTWSAKYGILTCAYRVQSVHNEDLAKSLAIAINQWQIDSWLEQEPRLRASVVAPSQNSQLAVDVIDQFADHTGFVQIMLPVRSLIPYGNRFYDPIYAAATRHDVAIGIHYGGAPGHPPTPAGWPSTYLEEYAGMAQVFQSQIMSMVIEGVFERHPTLRVALIESGFTWLPSLMWRWDKEWKGLRHNTPWVKRPPSDYIREHVRLTTQPFDAPSEGEQVAQIVEQMESDDLLMFATDYPHRHGDILGDVWPLPERLRNKVLYENARTFYSL